MHIFPMFMNLNSFVYGEKSILKQQFCKTCFRSYIYITIVMNVEGKKDQRN